jgi:hypothetical protein
MRAKLSEAKAVDVKSVEWILECAAVLGWDDLLRRSAAERMQVAYETGANGVLEHLKLWSSPKRGEWDLVCDYWLETGELHEAGATFRGGFVSGVLAGLLDFIMGNQSAFTAASCKPSGLIQVARPTPDAMLRAEQTMNAALTRTSDRCASIGFVPAHAVA